MVENSTASEMKSTSDVIRQGKDRAAREVKDAVRDAARQQKSRAAEGLAGFAGALHRSAGDLGSENEILGRYTNMAAERLERISQTLRDRDVDELIVEAEDLARRQPALFIGTAMAAGFLMARFLKSSRTYQGYGAARSNVAGSYAPPAGSSDLLQPGGSAI